MDPAFEQLTQRYPALNDLPEPTRAVALQSIRRSLQQGVSEPEAVERALGEAQEWTATRAPGGAPPGTKGRLD